MLALNTGLTSVLSIVLTVAIALDATVCAQDVPDETAPASTEDVTASRPMPSTIGGMPEPASGELYTSPLQTFGVDLGLGSYAIGALSSLIYLVFVYPLQALFGSSKVEPVMLWMLLPIAGPWMAQYESSVKDKPVWRGVLIADAGLQATGLVLGLIGYALSGPRARPERASLELTVGVAGASGAGLTLAVHTL